MLSVVVNTTAFSSRWEGSYSGVPSARLPWDAGRGGEVGGWGVLSEVGGGGCQWGGISECQDPEHPGHDNVKNTGTRLQKKKDM